MQAAFSVSNSGSFLVFSGEDLLFSGTAVSFGTAIVQQSVTTFVANPPGWYSVTYDLAFTEGSAEPDSVMLMVNGVQAGGQVPFTAPGGSAVSNVSDTQLFDCASGGCAISLLTNPGGGIFQLQYADVTITQVNSSG